MSQTRSSCKPNLTIKKSSRDNESGMTTISYVLATGLSLIVITWCTMFIIMSYSRAAVRNASVRATRAGVVAFSTTQDTNFAIQSCRDSFDDELADALPLNVRNGISRECRVNGTTLSVQTSGSLRSVSSIFPPFSIDETTRRELEGVL